MSHPKTYPIQIWFLDDDLQKSAEYQTNKTLLKSIDGCYQALVAARLYFIGIRSKTFFKHYFSKENMSGTMDRFFPSWPLHRKPSFQNYASKTSKWCRMCKEHYDYVKRCLRYLLDEYQFRFKKDHGLSKFLEWLDVDAPKLEIPEAHISKISIPWKCLNPRWRRKVLVDGYRQQLVHSFEDDDAYKAYSGSPRDIPPFINQHFKLDQQQWL